ncbi:oxaloacetate decarboxylase subunit alpha [Solemya pervernicosa gill symbiont]|uniref:Oxaloacetate decarboxylase subunit alpha n=2 Tax=Gammaproteobacteria incertae sedis TaxID=118884 RepID=A0A1T2L954_9GAMM|nr:sodium-extruding oxaloacetate decarboxylase subunit alpha [Candidatus Reidiella endopervernicosa]OOZ41610.1 oxaloacetate decarboxylase subunit alpha [Solemya pervernicosa gill symbiont]QKQ26895.1 sodium-extruding oxaloacetate decarboxylase subunit alpha [Candidatus Reidiella endopervernicosa]
MPKVEITDTILRDAHQSLLATRMRTEHMLPICERLDRVGYWSLEVWGGATFDACIRFLKEDPWERLRTLREALPNTRLQMLLRGQNLLGYRHYSDDVVRAFVDRSADNGIDVFRIFDALNDTRNLRTAIESVKAVDKHAQGAICYTTSPLHTTETFVSMARELESMGCDSIAIKDMAGLLTPMVTADLVAALRDAVDLPLHLHSHATAGLSEMCQLKAIENGCYRIDTAISSMASGASHSPTESMVAAFRNTEYDTGLDLTLLQEIGFYFREIRRHYHQFESDMTGLDTRVQVNQVPGGMISNLSSQLKDQGALDRINEVLDEIPRVREDLGFPPLVTPSSQIVGTQAVLNVVTGERYKTVTNEVKNYLLGHYGKAPGEINEEVRSAAIGDEKIIDCRPADILYDEMDKLRGDIGELAKSDEDLLIYAMFPEIGKTFLEEREAGTLTPETLEQHPDDAPGAVCFAPTEFAITLHGETYHINVTGAGKWDQEQRPFYMSIDGVPEELMIESLGEMVSLTPGGPGKTGVADKGTSKRLRATEPGHVKTSMPGTIVDVLVSEGDEVAAGDPLLITEAMKMETEVQAPITGTIKAVHIKKGDSVNPDEALIEIE